MSIIYFKCQPNVKEELKNGVWKILHEHYFCSVFPNTRVKYEDEGEEVYRKRLDELMKVELCKVRDTEDGICVEFDSTENAGFSIADSVYGTYMGYCDDGLTYVTPIFKEIIKVFPNICFEADCECMDKWICEEYHCSYDGEMFVSEQEEYEE